MLSGEDIEISCETNYQNRHESNCTNIADGKYTAVGFIWEVLTANNAIFAPRGFFMNKSNIQISMQKYIIEYQIKLF